ncbi:TIGR02530 family flagellar biosynthesis protein [Natronospora cellulosivora (SeqCode)]
MSKRLMANQSIKPIRPKSVDRNKQISKQNKNLGQRSFADVFRQNLEKSSDVKFSKHAQNRLISRNISLSEKELNQLSDGVKKAEEKGSRDSLIMVNNVAYLVSVQNKTVVTAVDDKSMEEKVFTNIDSAVFMD